MKIAVLAAGSRGDIQPYLSLAWALQRQGHAVRLAANANFRDMAASYGLPFFPIQVDSQAFVQQQEARAWLESRSPLKLALTSLRAVRPTLGPLLRDAWRASEGAEAIIYHAFTLPMGYYIGRQRGVPCLAASMYPMPTRTHPALPLDVQRSLGGPLNLLSHLLVDHFTWLTYRPAVRAFWQGETRIALSSPRRALYRERGPILCCYSPAVLPAPPDLPGYVHLTGYWFLDPPADWKPDPALVTFLESGPPPVYIGFGSMGNPARARETTAVVLTALAATGQRAVLAAGWSGLGTGSTLSPQVFRLQSAPHTWLLPRMAAIVHHGGVGTTGASLRAGVPNIVVPHFADQYFWGRRVAALGAGPQPIPRPQLTVERLAQALNTALDDPAIRRRAAEIGARLRAENGLDRAVELIHCYLDQAPATS